MVEGRLEEDLREARRQMQVRLLRNVFWLVTLAAGGLAVRELFTGGPVLTALLALLVGVAAVLGARRRELPPRLLGFAFFCALALLIANAARSFGGAAGSALSFAFIPGLLAGLVLGPWWGWSVVALMVACSGYLYATTPLAELYDRLRFIDELSVAVLAAGLAHAVVHSFDQYEAAAAQRRALLLGLREQRERLTLAIYEELEPLSTELVHALDHAEIAAVDRASLLPVLERLIASLTRAKALAKKDEVEFTPLVDPDRMIRSASMRLWLRLGAALMLFFVARNLLLGAPWLPSLISVGSCMLFDAWLRRPASAAHLEATALAIGVVATGPMLLHIYDYGVSPEAPPLVVTPLTVLFTALLSQGPAAWAILALNVGVVVWTGMAKPQLSLFEWRLLGDLALSFAIVVVALRCIFALRLRYTQVLVEQGKSLVEGLRQQRRLAGTLFHDVSNHLQALVFLCEFADAPEDFPSARSLSRRVQRLIALSKGFLLGAPDAPEPALAPVSIGDAVDALKEAFALRLSGKHLKLEAKVAPALSVRAQPDLLVESVLGNLVSNAVKFSPRDSVIDLNAEEQGGFVRLVISDSGPGVPDEVVRQLGQDTALPSRKGTEGEQGQGYGLQLAQEHLLRIGGRLELQHRAGGGTDAVVWLPCA